MRFSLVPVIALAAAAAEPGVLFDGKLRLIGETRIRYEDRSKVNFGAGRDYNVAILRQRAGFSFKPSKGVEFRVVGQDTRAPLFGHNAPSSLREGTDLYEAYVDLFDDRKKGFAMRVGRTTLSYGDTRLIGSPQWANLTRVYEMARTQWRTGSNRYELLFISPVQIYINRFNRSHLREHAVGTYNVIGKKFEIYGFRHVQPGTLEAAIAGGRIMQPLGKWRLTLEPVAQRVTRSGSTSPEGALVVNFSRKVAGVDINSEYKYASPGFDQMYPAIHDKLGHEDLFAWRNLHNARVFATWRLPRGVAWNFMYNANWLADPRAGVFNTQGRLITRDPRSNPAHWAGQEFDSYVNWQVRPHFVLSGGFGVYFNGGFFKANTPGRSPAFFYLSHTFTL